MRSLVKKFYKYVFRAICLQQVVDCTTSLVFITNKFCNKVVHSVIPNVHSNEHGNISSVFNLLPNTQQSKYSILFDLFDNRADALSAIEAVKCKTKWSGIVFRSDPVDSSDSVPHVNCVVPHPYALSLKTVTLDIHDLPIVVDPCPPSRADTTHNAEKLTINSQASSISRTSVLLERMYSGNNQLKKSDSHDKVRRRSIELTIAELKNNKSCFYFVTISSVSNIWGQFLMIIVRDISVQQKKESALSMLNEAHIAVMADLLPLHAIEHFAMGLNTKDALARHHFGVTIMFMDIVGFTEMCERITPTQVMSFLNTIFTTIDTLIDKHRRVFKIETAGDSYVAGGGILERTNNDFLSTIFRCNSKVYAECVMKFAKQLLYEVTKVNMPHFDKPCKARIGLHSGDVVSGIIGCRQPKLSIFGDTMNTASRMESTAPENCIQVSESTMMLLGTEDWYELPHRIHVKGKGLMQTYLWKPCTDYL